MTNIFGQIFTSASNAVATDLDWDTGEETVSEKPKQYLNFTAPPLELVVAMLDANKQLFEIVETVRGVGINGSINVDNVVDRSHRDRAQEIYDYFAKKYTLRRLKGEFISKYMTAVEELCEDRTNLNVESLPILVTLPKIYAQNRELEPLMKTYDSVPLRLIRNNIAVDETVEFVKKIVFDRKGSNETHYYWRRPTGSLLRTVSKTHEISNSAWECLAKAGKIHVTCPNGSAARIAGYEFYVLSVYNPLTIDIVG